MVRSIYLLHTPDSVRYCPPVLPTPSCCVDIGFRGHYNIDSISAIFVFVLGAPAATIEAPYIVHLRLSIAPYSMVIASFDWPGDL